MHDVKIHLLTVLCTLKNYLISFMESSGKKGPDQEGLTSGAPCDREFPENRSSQKVSD